MGRGQGLRPALEFDLGGDGTGDLGDTQQRHLSGRQVRVNVQHLGVAGLEITGDSIIFSHQF